MKSPLLVPGEMMKKLTHVVQMGWFNHQQRKTYATFLVVWLGGEISPPVYTFLFFGLSVGCWMSDVFFLVVCGIFE